MLAMALINHLIEAGGVAQRIAIAHQEHGELVVVAAMLADLLALVEMGDDFAMQGAGETFVGDAADGEIERRIPRGAEPDRLGPHAQAIGGVAAHADGIARLPDAAGQRLEEARLLERRPAIVAGAEGYGRDDALVAGGMGFR